MTNFFCSHLNMSGGGKSVCVSNKIQRLEFYTALHTAVCLHGASMDLFCSLRICLIGKSVKVLNLPEANDYFL